MPVAVRELELDLDAFEGPFDLLLSLVLREELPLREIDLAAIIVFVLAVAWFVLVQFGRPRRRRKAPAEERRPAMAIPKGRVR